MYKRILVILLALIVIVGCVQWSEVTAINSEKVHSERLSRQSELSQTWQQQLALTRQVDGVMHRVNYSVSGGEAVNNLIQSSHTANTWVVNSYNF